MARLGKTKLFAHIVSAIEADGWTVALSSLPREHPLRLTMTKGSTSRNVRAYVWNLTHGGGAKRPQHEQRIQITKVSQFEPEPDGVTLILGWAEEAGIFAGFDIAHHRRPLGSSPSIQIDAGTLGQAARAGIATHIKSNREVAVAVRPDHLAAYISHFDDAHTGALEAILGLPSAEPVDFHAWASPEQRHDFGHRAELDQRRSVLERLDALEREIEAIRPQLGMMGHNNPPETIEPDPGILADEVTNAVATIREELAEDEPDTAIVARGATTLQRIWRMLRSARDEAAKFGRSVKDKARDKVAELVVAAAGGSLLYGPQILDALQTAFASVAHWFQLILG